MRLSELEVRKPAVKALKENFKMDFDPSRLGRNDTINVLTGVRKLLSETRRSPKFQKRGMDQNYMKLVFMEQALEQHMSTFKEPRIIYENEEVEKSQVILAAQDMVDTVQKMYEDANDMAVKELPALVNSIQSEIGVNESDAFNQAVSDALGTLNTALMDARTNIQSALNQLTGQGGDVPFNDDLGGDELAPEMDDLGDELPPSPGDEFPDDDLDMGLDDEEMEAGLDDEDEALSAVGRAKR